MNNNFFENIKIQEIIFYHIFKLLSKQGESKIFINRAYEEIMKTGSKLNNKDKNKFLTENKFVSNIIKEW